MAFRYCRDIFYHSNTHIDGASAIMIVQKGTHILLNRALEQPNVWEGLKSLLSKRDAQQRSARACAERSVTLDQGLALVTLVDEEDFSVVTVNSRYRIIFELARIPN